ncbi:NADH-quinone oxidoreductase subunit E [Desulfosarcina alkanivorans]|uniref:NADH-quinone oxidoreductase subunit E n=1 Tax=Desulfosarcina alkanivorans TaxID=571177 RepID=A0A5K7YNC8_9BACT|nr:NADH-quinone oxidoreductase subunit NuoE [Desulfosarcina alkanivorans]BBO69379.1 NADH-quinone oxidoreductase subunit E [Desulfosarcina alkanivorans]
MLPETLKSDLQAKIDRVDHPREMAIDVINALQDHYGWFSDEALVQAADLLGMSPLEVDELATFYTFIYREPVGRHVIHVCDSLICWMEGGENLVAHLCDRLGIPVGGTTADGLFTLLPVCCIGYCDRAPAILVDRRVHGPLTIESLDRLIDTLQEASP